MDRGGTITWYLNADDASFLATLARARAEAKAAGADIDKSLTRSARNASSSLQTLGNDSNKVSGSVRTLKKDVVDLGSGTNGLKSSLTGVSDSSSSLTSSLGSAALRSEGLRESFGGLTDNSKRLNTQLGSNALRGFGLQLSDTGGKLKNTDLDLKDFALSLRDFHQEIGRGATVFRNFQIALRGFELTALIIGASVAAGAIVELAGNVAALIGLLAAGPAAIGVFASAIAALGVGTMGVADAFKQAIKPIKGATAAQKLGRRESDINAAAMKRDASLVRQLSDLNEQYGDTLQELADERLRVVNEQIQVGIDAWEGIAKAASNYLDVSSSLANLQLGVSQAQAALTAAIFNYGTASQQAIEASRNLYVAQGKLAQSNAELDSEYETIKDSIKDLATNVNSLRKANRNQISATQANLKALRLDKQARGENIDEITSMIDVLDQLATIKDTDLGPNLDISDAQAALDQLKAQYPDIAVAAEEAATDTEKALTNSLSSIADSMADVRREREELQQELTKDLADALEQSNQSLQGKDPFQGLSTNARAFAETLVDLYAKFQPVKNAIQDKLFAGLDTEIRNVATTAFPLMQDGLGNIATSLNGVAKEASRVVQQPFFTGALQESMSTSAKSIDILKGAIEPLAKAFTDLMNIGNPYILMLSNWIVRQTELVAAFTGSKKGQDKLTEAIDLGISALKQIMDLFGAVGKLVYDVFKTANESGFSMVKSLTQIVENVDKWVKTKEGQEALKALFEASNTILMALAGTIGDVLKFLLGIIKAYNDMDGPVKDIITNIIVWSTVMSPLLTYMSSLTASLKLMFGVGREAFQAVNAGIKLVQAGPAVVESFKLGMQGLQVANEGVLGSFGKLGNAVGATRDAFGGAVGKVKTFGSTLVNTTKDSAKSAAKMVADGAKAAAGWIANAAKVAAAWATQFALMVARGVVVVATMVGQAVAASAAWVAGAVATAAAWVIANLAILGVWGLIIAAVVGAVALIIANWDSIVSFFQNVWNGILTGIQFVWNWIKNNWPLLLAILTGPIGIAVYVITQNWETIKNAFAAALDFIKNIWGSVTGFFSGIGNGIVNIFNNIKNGIVNAFNVAINWIRGVPGSILSAFGNVGNILWDSGWSLIMGLWNGISNAFGRVKDWTSDKLRSLRNLFPFSPAKEGPFSGSGYTENSGVALMKDFGMGIASMGNVVLGQTEDVVGKVADTFSGLVSNVGAMQTDFGLSTNTQLATDVGSFAPAVIDNKDQTAQINNQSPVVIYQNNDVHTDLDMDQVNRNLAWEMNKL